MSGMRKIRRALLTVVATIATVLFPTQTVLGQESFTEGTSYMFLESSVYEARLPEVSQNQCQDFKWHIISDHPERLEMALKVLESIATGSLVASQVRTSGTRAVAVLQTREFGKVVLIWGSGVIPTTFDASQSWINRELRTGRKVDATSAYARRVLSEVAKAFKCVLPKALPQPEPIPVNEPIPVPKPRKTDFQYFPVFILFIGVVVLLGAATSMASKKAV